MIIDTRMNRSITSQWFCSFGVVPWISDQHQPLKHMRSWRAYLLPPCAVFGNPTL